MTNAAPGSAIRRLLLTADGILRPRTLPGAPARAGIIGATMVIIAGAAAAGAVMGMYGGLAPDRFEQILYSSLKLPVLLLGTFETVELSVYFSLASFTTLGYGDVTLGEDIRVFGAFTAVTGMLTFGVSTAFLVGLIARALPKNLH